MQVRPNSKPELNSTLVLKLDLVEVSAKVRTGGPKDDEKDYQLPDVWAGVLPFAPLAVLPPVDDDRLLPGTPAHHVTSLLQALGQVPLIS